MYFILCTAVPGKWMSAGTQWQTSLFTVNGDWGRPLPFLSLKVQRLFSYVTVALIRCVLRSSLFSPCQHRCSDGRLGPFLICDVCRSRPLHCSRGAEARGPLSGIWGRYGMVQDWLTHWCGSCVSFYKCALCACHSQLALYLIGILFHNPESSGLSFQLASLDESGVLNFWVGWATK